MAGNWSDYEHDCANLLSMHYDHDYSNIEITPKGEHNAYEADAGVVIDGCDVFSVEFKKVLVAGDKCTMAPFTMTEENGLLELTDSAENKINDIEGMLDVACEVQWRSEEIIPKDGRTAYIREWNMYGDDDEYIYGMSADDLDLNFQMYLCMMASDFYRKCKDVSFFMIGDTPFPFINDWMHINEYFDFYVQVRAKGSGGSKIRASIMAELENALYLSDWVPDDAWYIDDGRLYVSPEYAIDEIFCSETMNSFERWSSEHVFALTDPAYGDTYKLNVSLRDGWAMLKPHPVNLTVMPYAIYNGNIPDIFEAWAEMDKFIRKCGGDF